MEFLGTYITDKQNYIGFTYKSPITYIYLFTVYSKHSPYLLAAQMDCGCKGQ